MKKSEEKHIWKCVYCGARIKALGSIMPKPKECPNCKHEDFV